MSVENVTVVVNIKTLEGRFIAHKFSTGWEVGVVKSCGNSLFSLEILLQAFNVKWFRTIE